MKGRDGRIGGEREIASNGDCVIGLKS